MSKELRSSSCPPIDGTLKGKRIAHWFTDDRAWHVGKAKNCKALTKQDEMQQKVTVGWKVSWQEGQTAACDFRLRQREYGDRGLATWCVVEKK